ncbi:MAG TPA: hypothetical protein VK762_34745, partial [Polyangiaceae bacterium]|nr:hypothetical protein [Polyangiaceae bacterium]
FTRSGWAQLAIDSALSGKYDDHRWCNEAACAEANGALHATLENVRQGFGDFATLDYPSGPDELTTWFDYYDYDELDLWPGTDSRFGRPR